MIKKLLPALLLMLFSFGALAIDTDGDGVDDGVDAFPNDGCASVDTDHDGKPDTIIPAGNCIIDGFETGNFSANPWVLVGSSWSITSGGHSGNYAAKASGSQQGGISITRNFAVQSTLAFFSKRLDSGGGFSFDISYYGSTVTVGTTSYWAVNAVMVPAGTRTLNWYIPYCGMTGFCIPTSALLDDIGITTLAVDADDDNDGVADAYDKFPLNAAASSDTDNDGFPGSWNAACDATCQLASGLTLDNCPTNANADQLNTDGDAQGNVCDADDDNDGVLDTNDVFPLDPTESVDTDSDGIGNNADTDDDNDGIPDAWEILYGLNPLINDAAGDLDGDGYTNVQEYNNGTDPTVSNAKINNDFDADGKSDALLRNISTGDWSLAQLDGTTVINQSSVGAFSDIENVIVSTADFNGDGTADILTRGTANGFLPGTFHIDLMSGQNVVDSNWLTTMSTDLDDEVVSTKDFNRDGKADVLLRNKVTGVWTINYMNGTSDPVIATLNASTDTCYTVKGDGDYDGNSYPDLLLRNDHCGGDSYPWLVYTTDGTPNVLASGAPAGLTQNTSWAALVTDKDFNGDGKDDVLMRAQAGSVQQWLLYNMNGTNAPTESLLNLAVQSMWQFVSDADLNGDGKADVMIRSTNTGQWYAYQLDNTTITSAAAPNTYINPVWSLQGMDDYDSDGKSDMLLRNSASGNWQMYLMNGTTVQSSGAPTITTDTSYVLQND